MTAPSYKTRPNDDYWYRFEIGDRVEGIPESATLAGRRGTVLGYDKRSDAMVVVRFDDQDFPEANTVSLLRKLDAVTRLGEVSP